MLITSPYRALSIGKFSTYYALCGIVLIFSSEVMSLLTRPILENSYTSASFWLNSIALRISCSLSRISPIIIRSNYSSFSYILWASLVYYGLRK
jgi:hypothetical protein